MNPILKNILAVVVGCVIGSMVNMAFVVAGPHFISVPAGIDITTMEGLKAGMHLMKPINFLFPFLAHAIGTLAGAFIAAKFSASHKLTMAMIVGVLMLIAGIMNIVMLPPAPMWFNVLDLGVAFLPMAYIGYRLAGGGKSNSEIE
jgi:uncharacterized membrane protein YqgA involved in biofilm formation